MTAYGHQAPIVMQDKHFAYLVLQCGDLDHLKKNKREWAAAYRMRIAADFEGMKPWLPALGRNVLDVGSGLSGVGLLVRRHYQWGRGGCRVWLLDGVNDPPNLVRHAQTFCSEEIARDFWRLNTEELGVYLDAAKPEEKSGAKLDLVWSFQSWCFHYGPEAYLPFVLQRCHPGTVFILDVRVGRVRWRKALDDCFQQVGTIHRREKCERAVFLLRDR